MDRIENSDIYPRRFSIGEIIEIAWNFFLKNFYRLMAIDLIVIIPTIVIFIWVMPAEFTKILSAGFLGTSGDIESLQGSSPDMLTGQVWNMMWYLGVLGVLNYLVTSVQMHYVYSNIYRGGISIGESIKKGLKSFLPMLATLVVILLISIPSAIFLLFPFVIFIVWASQSLFATVIRGKIGWYAIKYSYQMVLGRWWLTFAYLLTFSFLNYLIALVILIPVILFVHDPRWLLCFNYIFSSIAAVFFNMLLLVMAINYEDTTDFDEEGLEHTSGAAE